MESCGAAERITVPPGRRWRRTQEEVARTRDGSASLGGADAAVQGLQAQYGKRRASRRLAASARARIAVLVGPQGWGKTDDLEGDPGPVEGDGGEIDSRGNDSGRGVKDPRSGIGYYRGPSYLSELTVRENPRSAV